MKNPFQSMSPRAIRATYAGAAIVVLMLGTAKFYQTMYVRPICNDQCRWAVIERGESRLLITDIVRGGRDG